MASKLSRLQARLVKVDAAIALIEAGPYGRALKNRSYTVGFGSISVTSQEFSAVASEYRSLLEEQEKLEDRIAEIDEAQNSSCVVASFRTIQ